MALTEDSATPIPIIERTRHDIKRRDLTVSIIERITPHMIRLVLTDDSLADFVSGAPDDHIKVFFPLAEGEPARRDYTPRRFSQADRSLTLDFVDHEGGPAADWARGARVGDSLTVAGPRGSAAIGGDIRSWVLIGDETALPAIARMLESLPAETTAVVRLEVTDQKDRLPLRSAASLDLRWLYRGSVPAARSRLLLDALAETAFPERDIDRFVWFAAEADIARRAKAWLRAREDLAPSDYMAAGFWRA